jgi:hypothetical protein
MHNFQFSSTCYLLCSLALLRPVAVCLLLPGCPLAFMSFAHRWHTRVTSRLTIVAPPCTTCTSNQIKSEGQANDSFPGIFRKRHSLFMRDRSLMTRSLGIKVKTRLFFSDPDLDFYPDSLEVGEEQGQTPPMLRPFRARNEVVNAKNQIWNAVKQMLQSTDIIPCPLPMLSVTTRLLLCQESQDDECWWLWSRCEVSSILLYEGTSTPKRICMLVI